MQPKINHHPNKVLASVDWDSWDVLLNESYQKPAQSKILTFLWSMDELMLLWNQPIRSKEQLMAIMLACGLSIDDYALLTLCHYQCDDDNRYQ